MMNCIHNQIIISLNVLEILKVQVALMIRVLKTTANTKIADTHFIGF